jgi:small-conductance mechanosensitive channel
MEWFPEWFPDFSAKQFYQIAGFGCLLLLSLFGYRALRMATTKAVEARNLAAAADLRIRMLARWGIYITLGLIGLHLMGMFDNAWSFLTTLGAAFAVGFVALWSVLSNTVCALILVVYRPFGYGDDIELVDLANADRRIVGRIIEINLMFTVLCDSTGERMSYLHIPNNQMLQRAVRTFHRPIIAKTDRSLQET